MTSARTTSQPGQDAHPGPAALAAVDGEPVLLADRHDGSSEPTAVVLRQPLGRVVRARFWYRFSSGAASVRLSRSDAKRRRTAALAAHKPESCASETAIDVFDVGLAETVKPWSRRRATHHAAEPFGYLGLHTGRVRRSRPGRRACIGTPGRPRIPRHRSSGCRARGGLLLLNLRLGRPTIRRRPAAVAVALVGLDVPPVAVGPAVVAPVGRRPPRMRRGIQGQQHQEHGQQAAGRGVDHRAGPYDARRPVTAGRPAGPARSGPRRRVGPPGAPRRGRVGGFYARTSDRGPAIGAGCAGGAGSSTSRARLHAVRSASGASESSGLGSRDGGR